MSANQAHRLTTLERNVAASFEAVGAFKDVRRLMTRSKESRDWLVEGWRFYVDRGYDFGSAALAVCKEIEEAKKAQGR